MIEDIPGLRRGVRAMRVPKGLLFHDPQKWMLYLAPAGLPEEKLRTFLQQKGLTEESPEPARSPRVRQTFWVTPQHAPSAKLQILHGARYSCVACGTSCRTMKLGPISPEDVARMRALDWSGTGHDFKTFFVDGEGEPVDIDDWSGSCELFLRKEGGACQFLRADNLCDVHARFGLRAKPLMCQAFPYYYRATPTGMTVAMRLGECHSAVETMRRDLVEEQKRDLDDMLALHLELALLPPSVWFTPDELCTYEEYEQLEARLLEAGTPGSAGGAAAYARDVLRMLQPAPGAAAPLEELHEFVKRAREDYERPLRVAADPRPLDAQALEFEDRLCRQTIFNKDLFLTPELSLGGALMVLKTFLTRLDAPEGTAQALNEAWSRSAGRKLRELSSGLDLRALAERVLLLA